MRGADEIFVYDFDHNGVPELYVTSYSSRNTLLSSLALNGTPLWSTEVPRFSYSGYPTEEVKLVSVGDFDGNLNLDLVIAGEAVAPAVNYHPLYLAEKLPDTGDVVRFDRRWTYSKSDLVTSASFVSFYGGNEKYVLASSIDFNVYAISSKGKVVETFNAGSSVWDVEAFNADNDPKLEFLAATFSGVLFFDDDWAWNYSTKDRVSGVYSLKSGPDGDLIFLGVSRPSLLALNVSGGFLWERAVDELSSNVVVADLGSTGRGSILFGSGGTLSVLNTSGGLEWGASFDGRINSVAVVDVEGDGVSEIVLGLNDRIILLRIIGAEFFEARAKSYVNSALKAYDSRDLEKAVEELNTALDLYSQLNNTEKTAELNTLLTKIKKELLDEDKVNEGLGYIEKSRLLYLEPDFDGSLYYSRRALEIFRALGNPELEARAQELIDGVGYHMKADSSLAAAESLYVSGDFEGALFNAREALRLYSQVNNSLGIRKSESVVFLCEEAVKDAPATTSNPQTTTFTQSGGAATTTRKTAAAQETTTKKTGMTQETTTQKTVKPDKPPDEKDSLLYLAGILIVVMLIYMVNSSRVSRKKQK